MAFSTTSQLGYMFFACGFSSYHIALFHLLNHGFFKALLFLCAGTVIFLISHEQDLRCYGSILNFSPFLYSAFLVGNLALIGFPFLSGFYSKEIIIEAAFANYHINSYFIYWVSTLAAILTTWYSVRCIYLTFLIEGNWNKIIIQNIRILPLNFLFSIWILILGSCFSGVFFSSLFIGVGSSFFTSTVYITSFNLILDFEYLSMYIKNLPLFGSICGAGVAFVINYLLFLYYNSFSMHLINDFYSSLFFSSFLYYSFKIKLFISHKWFLDFLSTNYLGFFVLKHSYETYYKLLDKGFLEIFFFNGISLAILKLSYILLLQQKCEKSCFIILWNEE